MSDFLKIIGEVEFILTDSHGNIKEKLTTHNAVVDNGKNFIASRMAGTSQTIMSHMAIGTNSTPVASDQNNLLAQAVSGRQPITDTVVTANTIKYTALFDAAEGTGTIVEAGIFNVASGPGMLCRTVFNPINKDSTDTLTVNWTITINAA